MTSGSRPTATASISCSDHSKGASCSRAVMRMASSSKGRPTGESHRAFTPVPARLMASAAADGPPAGSGAAMARRLRDAGSTSAGSPAPVCPTGTAGGPAPASAADDVPGERVTPNAPAIREVSGTLRWARSASERVTPNAPAILPPLAEGAEANGAPGWDAASAGTGIAGGERTAADIRTVAYLVSVRMGMLPAVAGRTA